VPERALDLRGGVIIPLKIAHGLFDQNLYFANIGASRLADLELSNQGRLS
jgi:hypothetical protein